MRKSQFTEAQIVAIVRESEREGPTVGEVAKKHGITATTLFRWRRRFSGLEANQAAELRQLQGENGRLKKLLAQRDLEIDVLKEINAKRREQVDFAVSCGVWSAPHDRLAIPPPACSPAVACTAPSACRRPQSEHSCCPARRAATRSSRSWFIPLTPPPAKKGNG